MQENLSDLSARYRDELLRLYGKRTNTPPSSASNTDPPAPDPPVPEILLPIPEELPDETPEELEAEHQDGIQLEVPDWMNGTAEESAPSETEDMEKKPEDLPDAPAEMPEEAPQSALPETLLTEDPANTSVGTLIVRAVTGESAFPVAGAHVQVSTEYNGNVHLRHMLFTDDSGRTPAVEIPAPPAELSRSPENINPFGECSIRITADGFFTIQAEQVPIFAGITSVQTFEMIPLPLHMPENAETLRFIHNKQEV